MSILNSKVSAVAHYLLVMLETFSDPAFDAENLAGDTVSDIEQVAFDTIDITLSSGARVRLVASLDRLLVAPDQTANRPDLPAQHRSSPSTGRPGGRAGRGKI